MKKRDFFFRISKLKLGGGGVRKMEENEENRDHLKA